MKTYAYFPGCSLERMALSYHRSAMETTQILDVELKELEDWNCCGATAYYHVDELLSYALSARNLAMAEKEGLDVIAPCSACYKNLYFTKAHMAKDPDLAEHINFALEEDHLQFNGNIGVKHLIELFTQEIGVENVKAKVTLPLEGLRVAPYYGCQILRPRKDHEEVEQPQYFEALMAAIGAEPVDYSLKTRCCGGSLLITNRIAALTMAHILLKNAGDCGANVIATACPLCQVNLECYQQQINQEFGTKYHFPVVYFTQLIGLAFGVPPKRIGLGTELVSTTPLYQLLERSGAR